MVEYAIETEGLTKVFRSPGGRHGVGGHGALDHEEVRAPVAERQYEAEAGHQTEGFDAHGF